MLNVGVPEVDGPDAAVHEQGGEGQDPAEQNAETTVNGGIETGEQENIGSDVDPVEEPVSVLAAGLQESAVAVSSPTHEPRLASPHEPLENFGALLSEFERTHSPRTEDGSKQVDATVVAVNAESVFLNIGFKTEGVLPLAAFSASAEPPQVGDRLPVTVKGRNEEGYYDLSLLKIAQPKDWSSLEQAFENKAIIGGTVTGLIKGGFTVDVGVRAFMPGSRSGVREASEAEKLVGQEIRCRITKLDVADEDLVVDRRGVMEDEERTAKERRFAEVKEGDVVTGTVRSLTSYGAFVELGGVDALLHVSDISWARVGSPADVLSVGQEIQVAILRIEGEKHRISVGMKQLLPHPWDSVAARFQPGQRVTGVVTRLTDFGAFVELAPGIEGLVHISEMSWAKKVRKPADVVTPGETVEVVVLSIDAVERRIALGLKQALGDPWMAAAAHLAPGSVIEGPVVSFTKFGAFVQVAEGVEGMVHISEIAADKRINHPQDELRLGQVVKALVLEINKGKRQLKLSIKQLAPTGVDDFIAGHREGDIVSGRIVQLPDSERGQDADGLLVELGEGLRVACRLPAAAVPAAESPARPAMGSPGPDLSALSSMLKARWKSGPAWDPRPGGTRETMRTGQVRSFRITALEPATKRVAIELA